MAPWLTSDELTQTASILSKATWQVWGGANRMTGLVIAISAAAVRYQAGDVATAEQTIGTCFDAVWQGVFIQPGTGDGVQADGCFYQHGPFQQVVVVGVAARHSHSLWPALAHHSPQTRKI